LVLLKEYIKTANNNGSILDKKLPRSRSSLNVRDILTFGLSNPKIFLSLKN
tara:strand:+ start:184 stop:336 length:153 start_codon:yes stop_codon:yes gene_type:complete